MNEIADEMLKHIHIIALQDLRWKGEGQNNKPTYTLFYSFDPENTGHLGIGFMIRNEIKKNILRFEPYNERIC
jgi:hypothetical protein